ncbi:hypothetical protein [Streptomyces sp. NRRL S-118]|uniref:hypothetical protein n=1 Tax=Streptomyces sp. NRRL S-118 TaxID=1463881 RepID=UPI00131D5539|nr:hypothetical protein [Streptomyces sp. NRRL S-118]
MVAMRRAVLVVSVVSAAVALTVVNAGAGAGAGVGVGDRVPVTGTGGPAVRGSAVQGGEVRGGEAPEAGGVAPEADVAHHGHASLDGDRLDLLLASRNHGPSSLGTATVRLSFSVPVAGGPPLPAHCLWDSDREVLCSTGSLRADGPARETVFGLRTTGVPHEVTIRVATEWNGGASDRNPENNQHHVLVPATGDPYVF